MNEVTPLQVKSHWPTLKEYNSNAKLCWRSCITKLILVIKWVAMAFYELFRPGETFEDD